MPSAVCRALIAVLCLPLALFFAFVGWNKAFASLDELVRYGSWTVHLPEPLGRLVGWSELLAAVAMLGGVTVRGRTFACGAALALVANQLIATLVHFQHDETGALPQNAVLIAVLLSLAWLAKNQRDTA